MTTQTGPAAALQPPARHPELSHDHQEQTMNDPQTDPYAPARYPYPDGDFTVLGPEIFTDGEVICWRGENFVRQTDSATTPAVSAVVPPTQDTLDRIADVLAAADGWAWADGFDKTTSPAYQGYQERAAAVLAVLPPPANRAAVLREAAAFVDNDDDCDCGGCDSCIPKKFATDLRRMADEAAPDPSETHRLALSTALGLGAGAPWDAIRDRAQELAGGERGLIEGSRRALEQRQEMAAERFAWQERGDRAEKETARLHAEAAAVRGRALTEAADLAERLMDERYGPDCSYAIGGLDVAQELRRLAAETQQTQTETPSSTAPLAAGLPLVKGNCPACRRASLFLGTGGYPTCSNLDCTEPDAATTVLEQYANEAHEPEHSWAAELHDPLADEWVPGTRFLARERAVNALEYGRRIGPAWKDGTPTERRLVRATTTYTVEETAAPAVPAGVQTDEEARP